MFERGLNRGKGAAQEKCAAKMELMTCAGVSQSNEFLGGTGWAWVAQLVERVLGKDEVTGSIPVPGSRIGSRKLGIGSWMRRLGKRICSSWAGVTQR